MKGQAAGYIMIVITVMVGAMLIPMIANSVTACSTTYPTTVEWHNSTTNTSLVTVSNYPVLDGSETIKAYNETDGTLLATLVKDSNYTVTSYDNGQFQMVTYGPSFFVANLSFDYTYHDICYVSDTGTHAIMGLVTLFFILGLAFIAGKGFGIF